MRREWEVLWWQNSPQFCLRLQDLAAASVLAPLHVRLVENFGLKPDTTGRTAGVHSLRRAAEEGARYSTMGVPLLRTGKGSSISKQDEIRLPFDLHLLQLGPQKSAISSRVTSYWTF